MVTRPGHPVSLVIPSEPIVPDWPPKGGRSQTLPWPPLSTATMQKHTLDKLIKQRFPQRFRCCGNLRHRNDNSDIEKKKIVFFRKIEYHKQVRKGEKAHDALQH
jgi:hypothetical protein